MGIPQAKRFMEQASQVGIRTLVFTGGEPFNHPTQLRVLMHHADRHDMESALITNAAWASSRNKVREHLAELKEAGLRSITLSTDRYHLPAVPLERIEHVLDVAKEFGLRARVKIARLPHDPVAEGICQTIRRHTEQIVFQEVSPMGRGDSLRSELYGERASSFLGASCLTPPVLLPSGDLLTCCNLPAQDMRKEDNPFVLGNVQTEPLGILLKKRFRDPVLRALRTKGPGFLLTRLAGSDSSFRRHERALYHSGCDLCFRVFAHLTDRNLLYATVRDAQKENSGELK
jgi:hypothetical protein